MTASPRILILTNRIPFPLLDGGAIAMNAMLKGYLEQGFEVHLLAMNTSRHFVPVDELPELYKQIEFTTHQLDTDIRFLPVLKNFLLSREPNHAARFYDRNFELKLQRVIASFEPDFIQLESIFLSTYLPVIRSISKALVIIRLHNVEHEIWHRMAEDKNYSLKRYYLNNLAQRMRIFELQAWQHADLLLPITEEDAQNVMDAGINTPLFVVPFGIPVSAFDAEEKKPVPFTQGYHLGAMDWMPNADGITWFMEQVWQGLHEQVPAFQFTFAGRNMPASFVRLQKEGAVCAGEISDAAEFLKDKKVLIVPLHSGSGIRVKVLEAMAADKLVISTKVGMHGIIAAKPCVHFLQADTPEEFIKAIKWAVENETEAEEIARAGNLLVTDHYNHEQIMRNLKIKLTQFYMEKNV